MLACGAVVLGSRTTAQTTASPAMSSLPAAEPTIVRSDLGMTWAAAEPDARLELTRYTLEPGVVTPPTSYPGARVAWVESGVLAVTGSGGSVNVHPRDDGSDAFALGLGVRILVPRDWWLEWS